MPTLLQINTVVNAGSTGRMAEGIGRLAIDRGWDSYIAYGRNPRPSSSRLIRIGSDVDVAWHGAATRLFDRHGFSSKGATRKLLDRIEHIQPDIIHLHNLHGYYIYLPALFGFLAKRAGPVVWTLHDCWAFTGHCSHFSFTGCAKWETQCDRCPQKARYPASCFADRSRANFTAKKSLFTSVDNVTIITPSLWLSRLVRRSFLGGHAVAVINNGVDLGTFAAAAGSAVRDRYNLGGRKIVLGCANTWDDRKGLDDFFRLSALLPEDYTIMLIGLSKKQSNRLPPRVLGIAKTESTHELAQCYGSADVFVNLTYEDTFPTTNLEALACGTPVVTYDTGGSGESVTPETGRIVAQGDLQGVARAAAELVSADRAALSRRCRDSAVRRYNQDDRHQEYLQLYDSLL